jgi:hypothetical protein
MPAPACLPAPARVREKVNRPLTRRRRENTDECLEKLQLIRDNLSQSSSLVAHLVKREQKKRDIMVGYCWGCCWGCCLTAAWLHYRAAAV